MSIYMYMALEIILESCESYALAVLHQLGELSYMPCNIVTYNIALKSRTYKAPNVTFRNIRLGSVT